MTPTKLITVIDDSTTFIVNVADLTGIPNGEARTTQERDVPCSEGLKWNVSWYPTGRSPEHANHLGVYLNVNKAVSAIVNIKVNNSLIQLLFLYDFIEFKQFGCFRLAHHSVLRPLFVNGQLSISCNVKFHVPVSFTRLIPRSVLYSDHAPTDFALVVDSNRVQVHKSLLSLMSPVFHAMLSHDTEEFRNGEVEIKDFGFCTVKTAIDFCYGREMETPPVETIFDILRFADKYDIKSVTSLVEKMPQQSLSIPTFSAIIRYAGDFFKDDLFDECCKFFKVHQKDIVSTEKFTTLASPLVARLLKQAFDLKTEFDVLRHAHTNGITFILDPLEQPILESLSVETFCDTVSYAWDCSRDTLKKACAQFFNNHFAELCNMESFIDLGPNTVHGVMKLRREISLNQDFDMKTQFGVLRHAHANGIEIILDSLEMPILKSLSLETFCDTVSYAWDCSRESLKNACAEFFDIFLTEVSSMESFVNLPPSILQGLMKLRRDILLTEK